MPSSPTRPSLAAALRWGTLWSVAFGLWGIYPHFLRTQRASPSSFAEWLWLDALVIGTFALLGAGFSALASLGIRLHGRWTGRPLRSARWANALYVPLAVPPLYFGLSAVCELALFRNLVGLAPYRPFVPAVVGGFLVLVGLAIATCRVAARTRPEPSPRILAVTAWLALAAGLALAPIWGEPRVESVADREPLQRIEGRVAQAPLLFVGIDGGTWRILQPLLDAGKAPNLRRLIDRGVRGEVRPVWPNPIWSAPAWSAILTGYPRGQTGIYQEFAATAPGLPPLQIPLEFDFLLDPLYLVEYQVGAASGFLQLSPFPASALHRRPLWKLLHESGLRSAVIRFRFAHPAEGQADVVVSDLVGDDVWQLLGLRRSPSDAVAPKELAPALLGIFSARSTDADRVVAKLLPNGGPATPLAAVESPEGSLRIAADIDARTVRAAVEVLRRKPVPDALFVYLGGFDTATHAFWRYRFPEEFPEDPPSETDVRAAGRVLDGYLDFVDDGVGALIGAYEQAPNVVIVADHGAEALHGNRTYSSAHSARGALFVAAGPGIVHDDRKRVLSYLDVTPTILDLMGFLPSSNMEGKSQLPAAP